MGSDTIHIAAGSHPSFKLFGYEIILDAPLHTVLFAAFGAAVLLRYAWSWLRLLAELTVIPGISLAKFKHKNRSTTYALVTGCTAGIGLEFARQLAKAGFGVVLVGRRQTALDELAKEIEDKYKVPTKTVVADAADAAGLHAGVARIAAAAAGVDLGVLINNVGASHEMPVAFAETDAAEIDAIIQTNISWTLQLTRAILPQLVERSNKPHAPKSLVLNIGSLSGRIPSALLAAYSCTKGGLQTWNTAVATEVEPQGVLFRMVFPAFVVSNMSKIRRASITVPTAKAFVASTLGSIGLARGAQGRPYDSTPYPSHALLDYVVGLFGGVSEAIGVGVILSMHKDIRKRALRKKAREAEKVGKLE
ncbi:hypothetical protein Q8F55_006768 [Vanrija albida]|uniref:Very-long-chain 3-oxoacyl-CoA reductase n=1 Tax=Vanrija albida TaxID=181172 RepID=A0ABR3PY19_9TREE